MIYSIKNPKYHLFLSTPCLNEKYCKQSKPSYYEPSAS